MGMRDKRRGEDLKGATKGNWGIKHKIEREMRKSRRIGGRGSVGMRRPVGAMYDYRKRREGKLSVARGGTRFLIFFFLRQTKKESKGRLPALKVIRGTRGRR